MNVITIAGNLGKDIEIRRTPNGDAVGSFSVGDSQGQDKPTIWWRCQLWGKRAEALAPFLLKGQPVTVSGEVTEREYTDKDNQPRKAQEVRVNNVKLQGSKQGSAPTPAPQARREPAPAPRQGGSSGFSDMADDIPFTDPLKRRALALSI